MVHTGKLELFRSDAYDDIGVRFFIDMWLSVLNKTILASMFYYGNLK